MKQSVQASRRLIGAAIISAAWVMLGLGAQADVTLPAVICDNMVLQQGMPVPIWGWADPGEKVTVTFAGKRYTAVADARGAWRVYLNNLTATPHQKPQTMTVTEHNTLKISNILIGEVWLCSGQSNMQFVVNGALNAEEEIAHANLPQIRLFTVPRKIASMPQEKGGGTWQVCSPDTVTKFSAVGFFFGRHLYENLNVPIGLIHSSWGGTGAQAWTSAKALKAHLPEFDDAIAAVGSPKQSPPQSQATYQQKNEAYRKAYQKLCALEVDLKACTPWSSTQANDQAWPTMTLPTNWKDGGLPNVDGIVWFRKTIDIPKHWAGKNIALHLGAIDEIDVTWFNGKQVGSRGNCQANDVSFWDRPRVYPVPGKQVKAGQNVIAIRVISTTGAGGLWGTPADEMYVALADGSNTTHLPLNGDWRYDVQYALPSKPVNARKAKKKPTVLFNGMIHPLIPYAIRGAIWYQGEANVNDANQYRTLLPTMITDWRERWAEGNFPFLIVQLANYHRQNHQPPSRSRSLWAELREAQAMTAQTLPRVGLAVAIDLGEAKNIHPKNKQEVATRLGLSARAIAYGQKLVYSGPKFKSMKRVGGKARIKFEHAEGGLVAKGKTLTGFTICGPDHKFVWAKAKIQGNQVIVWSDKVSRPVAVRYAWADNPQCNLYNRQGLPAIPFRTDVSKP